MTQPMSGRAPVQLGLGLDVEAVLVGEGHLGQVPAVVCMMPLGLAVVPEV